MESSTIFASRRQHNYSTPFKSQPAVMAVHINQCSCDTINNKRVSNKAAEMASRQQHNHPIPFKPQPAVMAVKCSITCITVQNLLQSIR